MCKLSFKIILSSLNNPKSIHEAVLLFADDLYSEEGYSDFNPEYYYQLDFDKLFKSTGTIECSKTP